MFTAFSIVAIVIGAVGHLLLIGLCFAGMPNSSPRQMRQIQLWMLAILVVGISVAGVGVWLLRGGHPGWATAVNLASPVVMFIILLKGSEP